MQPNLTANPIHFYLDRKIFSLSISVLMPLLFTKDFSSQKWQSNFEGSDPHCGHAKVPVAAHVNDAPLSTPTRPLNRQSAHQLPLTKGPSHLSSLDTRESLRFDHRLI